MYVVRNKHVITRGFCKTEWTKPKHVDKPYVEQRRSDLPVVQNNKGLEAVRYSEIWKAWFTIEYELFNAFARNGEFFALRDPTKNSSARPDGNAEIVYGVSDDQESKRRHVDAILRTYSELQAFTSPRVKKAGFAIIEEKGPVDTLQAATVNATTKDIEEDEKLTQKLETIEEVPLVEADPDIIKPPKTSGPTVMNISDAHDYEEFAKNSDFQIGDDLEDSFMHYQEVESEDVPQNHINNYFKRQDSRKPNFSDLFTLNAVPEIDAEELSLTELLHRVRERNRLLRCRDIDHQLNATTTDDDQLEATMDRARFPLPQSHPTQQPGWGWQHQPQPQRYNPYQHPMQPQVAFPNTRKAEPITPDTRPGFNRASKVSPVTLALYLGPLVSALRNATVLFPLLTAYFIPKHLTNLNIKDQKNVWCVLHSTYENDEEDQQVHD